MQVLISNLALVAAVLGAAVAPRPAPPPPPPPAPQPVAAWALPPRERLMAVAVSQIGTQEGTGRNDGPVVKYLRSVGLYAGDPYCAAFVYWCGREALGPANPFPRSGYSPDFVTRPTWVRGRGTTPAPGDAFGIYFPAKGRIAHTGLVRGIQGRSLRTVEANTSPAASSGEADRNGDGVWSKLRPLSTIHSVRRWLP